MKSIDIIGFDGRDWNTESLELLRNADLIAAGKRILAALPPEHTPELYEPVGLDGDGVPLWSRPAGTADGYAAGDVVSFRGAHYRCLAPCCLASPEEAPADWQPLAPPAKG